MSKAEKIGEIIKKMRKLRGMSVKELAGILKCSKEIIRLWEHGKRKPNKQHTLELYRLLGATPGEGTINKEMGRICSAGLLINTSKQLTVYKKRNQIHLKKELLHQLKHSVEISTHPENPRELLIKEKEDGVRRADYYSAELVQKIAKEVGMDENMRFLCLWDEEEQGWRGVLLPEMKESFLWENIRLCPENIEENTAWKPEIFNALYRRHWNWAEREEIETVYKLAYRMVICSSIFGESKIWYLTLMYSSVLLDEMSAIQRRCRRAESSLSLDRPIGKESNHTLQEFFPGGDIPYTRFEITEFMKKLTELERIVLRWLLQERDPTKNINFGICLKTLIQKTILSLQQKTYEYYGEDYIRSILLISN